MSEMGIEALLMRLKSAPAGMSIQELMASLEPPQSVGDIEAQRRCALVRWFDQEVYGFLCADLRGAPEFPEMIASPRVQQLAPSKWAMESGERARALAAWQAEQPAWRAWNQKLGDYFAAMPGAENELSAVYHFAAATVPEAVEPYFQRWFSEADQRFDMAQCNALLEMLRVQESWRGLALSTLWQQHREYHSARVLFAEDYFKTGSYFKREEVLSKFVSVLDRSAPEDPWIFHIHASGGIGKTMFTRWLIARYLVPNRVPCARVDLDDYMLTEIVNFPLKVVRQIVEQWSKQPKGGGLSSLLGALVYEQNIPGWNRSLVDLVNSQLQGAGINSRIVVVLDTLEEATLSAAEWLSQSVSFLRSVKAILPQLTLVLSGRYDIAERCSALLPGEFIDYELPRFTEAESHGYLESRGILAGPVRDAIVARAAAGDVSDEREDQLAGRNPFKLAMLAELALNRDKLTAEEVLKFPRADIAYLIERVIRRIEWQPLRWIIRYGAVARHLTPEFAEAVLLPPLLRALRGSKDDRPESGLNEYEYKDVWLPDPAAAEELARSGIAPLWESLSAYARDRGWLSWVNSERRTELRFHPEVIGPTRHLVRQQEIFNELQERSMKFFEDLAQTYAASTPPQNADSVRASCEAVFHRFQLSEIGAEAYWIETLRRAERIGSYMAVTVAAEITGRDYAEAERDPYPGMSTRPLLIRAHCEAADLLMQSDLEDFKHWMEFRRHVELARAIAGDHDELIAMIPSLLCAMYEAGLRETAEQKNVVGVLSQALLEAGNVRDRFFLTWQLGKFLVNQGAPEAAIHLRSALELLSEVKRPSTSFVDIYLKLVDLYEFQGIHTAVIETLRSARKSTNRSRQRMRVMHREANYYLKVGDLVSAEKRLVEIRELANPPGSQDVSADILEARLANARLDPIAALQAVKRAQASVLSPRDRARCLDQEAEACTTLFDFKTALDLWNLASSSYDQARDPVGSARCALLSATLNAKMIGDFDAAETHVLSALGLRGSHDAEIQLELHLLNIFIHRRKHTPGAAEHIFSIRLLESMPVRLHARALSFALFFGLEFGEELAEELEDSLSEIQPLSMRDSVLDWAEYAEADLALPSGFAHRVMEQLARPAFESTRGALLLIQRANLYRVFGMPKEAEAELARVYDENFLVRWRLCVARERLELRPNYRVLLQQYKDSAFAETPLGIVLGVAAASEAIADGDFAVAKQILEARTVDADALPVVWQGRLEQARTKLKTPTMIEPTLPTPIARAPKGGAVPVELWTKSIVLTGDSDLPVGWSMPSSTAEIVDFFSTKILADWRAFASAMTSVLQGRGAWQTPIEPIGGFGALPWELGGAERRCSQKVSLHAPHAVSASTSEAVLLMLPDGGLEEISSNSLSGFSIEEIYRDRGINPRVLYGAGELAELANRGQAALLHIVAAIREASSGIYLDFSTSDYRAQSFGDVKTGAEISLTAFRLDRILRQFSVPPFVVLEIGLPPNSTESVHMLLLRNLYASQLFELGHVRGVLGWGLAQPIERYRLTSRLVETLLKRRVIECAEELRFVQALGHGLMTPQDIEFMLPRHCAALWSNLPDDRLFIP